MLSGTLDASSLGNLLTSKGKYMPQKYISSKQKNLKLNHIHRV